jgi:hypothetical protein
VRFSAAAFSSSPLSSAAMAWVVMSLGDDRALVSPPRIGSAGHARTRDLDRVRARPGDRRACAEGWCVGSVLPITRVF